MTTVEVLRKARELVAAPGAWTQRAFARDAAGGEVKATSPDATCWCTAGAILRIVGDLNNPLWDHAITAIADACGMMIVASFNDLPGRTQAEVVAAFDRAIASVTP